MYCNFKNQAKMYLLIFIHNEILHCDLNIENQNTF